MRVAGPGADSFMYIRYAGIGEHDGETLTTISGEGQSSCHQRHLVEEFARVLPPGTIKYGLHASKVVNGTDKASTEFTNGTVVEADFVISCDGIHGKTGKSSSAMTAKN
jgi:2-polyprenyl-6-methoxyphenol hydroxylase-like FAD-dependent oxidoreductase